MLSRVAQSKTPSLLAGRFVEGCLTMTYFRMGNPHYHRRAAVSRSCSGWEGVGPAGYGRQTLSVRDQVSGIRYQYTRDAIPGGRSRACGLIAIANTIAMRSGWIKHRY